MASLRNIGRTAARTNTPNVVHRRLLAEITATAVILTLGEVTIGKKPAPRTYLAAYTVFLGLSFLSDWGPSQAKLATSFGGLVLLVVALHNYHIFVTATEKATELATGKAGQDASSV